VRVVLEAFVYVLALSMSPGLVELVDDAGHVLLEGHTDCEEDGDECCGTGCTPTSHHCGCCISIAMAPASVSCDVDGPNYAQSLRAPLPEEDGPSGVRSELERPPSA